MVPVNLFHSYKSNPMSCAGINYRMLLNAKDDLTMEGLSVWNEICKLNDIINVIIVYWALS